MIRPVWRVNCLIKMFATDGADTSRVVCHRQGTLLVGDFRARFDAVTGREEVFCKSVANDRAEIPVELCLFVCQRQGYNTSRTFISHFDT